MKRSDEIKNTGPDVETGADSPENTDAITITGDVTTGIGNASGEEEKVALTDRENPQAVKPPRKPNLTDEQQLWLNKVFIPNFRRELMKNLKADQLLSDEERQRLIELRSKPKNDQAQKPKGSEDYEKFLKQKDEAFEEMKKASKEERGRLLDIITEIKVDRELIAVASQYNSVNPSQVAQLLRPKVRLDDDLKPVVLDDDGENAVNSEGKFMAIDEMVRLFLEGNPHMVRPSESVSGSGARDSLSGYGRITAITGGDLISEGLREESRAPMVLKR